jgi:hypothetical protein
MQMEDITNYQEVRDAIATQLRALHDTPNRWDYGCFMDTLWILYGYFLDTFWILFGCFMASPCRHIWPACLNAPWLVTEPGEHKDTEDINP